LIFRWIGLTEYIPCYSAPAVHWCLLPATRLASRKVLIEENIKKWTGAALCVLCGLLDTPQRGMFTYELSSPQIILESSYFKENIYVFERFKGIVL
jgi:hypothetical protein